MVAKDPVATPAHCRELRELFMDKYAKTPPKVPFHPLDLDRIQNEDKWLIRYLDMYDLDMKISLEKLWDTCIWRKDKNINELNEDCFKPEELQSGIIFPRNQDVDGKRVLIFKAKSHQKGSKDIDQVVLLLVYWIERIQRETDMDTLTIFFDLDQTSLGNVDLDLIKRMIETFKLHYPSSLNYILVFEMAWILNAVFKIIKGLLPPKAIEILKTITKKDINTYIDKDNCLKSWGGNDNYQFKFEPEVRMKKDTKIANGTIPIEQHNGNDKKVHFANSSPGRVQHNTEYGDGFNRQDREMLRVIPNDKISFSRGENSQSVIEITCIAKTKVTFKIQTTSPEKFRVRPRCGVLNPGESVNVGILLKPDQTLTETKDKFNVMGQPIPGDVELTSNYLSEVWKSSGSLSPEVEQHRICCIYKNDKEIVRNGGAASESDGPKIDTLSVTIDELSKQVDQLKRQATITYVIISLILLFLLGLSGYTIYLLRLPHTIMTESGTQVPDEGCQLPKQI